MKQSIQYGIVWLLGIALMSPLFGWSQGLVTGTVSDENGMPPPGAYLWWKKPTQVPLRSFSKLTMAKRSINLLMKLQRYISSGPVG